MGSGRGRRPTLREFLRWTDEQYRRYLIRERGMTPDEADALISAGRAAGDGRPLIEPTGRRSPSEAGGGSSLGDVVRALLGSPVFWAFVGLVAVGVKHLLPRRRRAKSREELLV